MSARLPSVSIVEVLYVLGRAGFVKRPGTKKHFIYRKAGKTVVVPHRQHQVRPGAVESICRQAGISKQEFVELLKS